MTPKQNCGALRDEPEKYCMVAWAQPYGVEHICGLIPDHRGMHKCIGCGNKKARPRSK